ncbi:Uncharacterised protein [Mycobacterium tuberculosis]|uniref:Uncharacterized protein n=1 Tax=Mycobacterium tuberculosis TaxID=1773 RepID=A0A916L8C6_MYCTX|nr:Uncharacterised protein [Mycobacterium tuberculosis]
MTTLAPILDSASMTPKTASSLPGISDDDNTMRSPAVNVMLRCSPRDIRDNADIGSPWVPVVINTTWSGAIVSAAAMSMRSESATRRKPSCLATRMLRTIDRPTNDTRRPNATAASMICCTRSTLEAKHATITRPSAPRMSRCSVGPTSLSDGPTPGISAFVESHSNRSTPVSPSRDMPGRSVGRPSGGNWSNLMSPVCRMVPAPVYTAMANASGVEWLTAKYSHSNTPCRVLWPSRTSTNTGVMRYSRHFSATRAKVNFEPTTGMSGRSLSRNGIAPMWSSCPWVNTSASMSSSRSSTWRMSGRIRSTPGSSWPGNNTPQSIINSRPRCSKTVMLRPISLMPPSAVTRNPPEVRGPGGGRSTSTSGPPFGSPLDHRSTEAARMSAANASICSGVAATWGSRGSPTSMPCSRKPALDNVTPPRRLIALHSGATAMLILRAVAISPEPKADNNSRSCPAARWAITLMKPVAPMASQGRLSASSPE